MQIRNRKKRSIIWSISKEEFQKLIDEKSSLTNILKFFGLENKGNNFLTLKRRISEDNICLEKFHLNKEKEISERSTKSTPLDQILVENSFFNRCNLKKKLLDRKLLDYVCFKCGLNDFWNGEKLVLQLEHKNGISTDNRLENLCLLCPNCHSQTKTFAGKRFKKEKVIKVKSLDRLERRKVEWPIKELLEKLLWEKPTIQIAKEYGVSDKSVTKWAKKYNLKKPPRGYWSSIT